MYDDKKYICELSFDEDDGYHLSDQQDSKDALDILDVMYYGEVGKQFTKNSATWENCVPWLDTLAELHGYRMEKPVDFGALKVSPNPGTGEFYISLPTDKVPANIIILNSLGQVVDAWLHEENFSTEVLVDITGQPNGMYFAKVMMNGQVQTVRFLKQN